MTPREKAKELVGKYYHLFSVDLENTICIYEAKQCALIAVEFAKENPLNTDGYNKYLQEVKQEIQAL